MDILEIGSIVKDSNSADLSAAITTLDAELAAYREDIVKFCAQGNTEAAFEQMQEYEKVQALRNFVREIQKKGRNYTIVNAKHYGQVQSFKL